MTDVLLLRRQLNELTMRVARIEAALELDFRTRTLPRAPAEAPTLHVEVTPIPVKPAPRPPTPLDTPAEIDESEFAPEVDDAPPSRGERARALLGRESRGAWDLEQLVAGRWYAIAGALIVVVGMGLFLKLGMERGWFTMPPTYRCLTAAAFGILLLASGEWVRRRSGARINGGAREGSDDDADSSQSLTVASPVKRFAEYAPIGLNAAGVGTIYAAAYAAYALYALVSAPVAFALLSAVAVLGIAVGVRTRQVSVAAVGLVGGYLSLLLIRAENPSPFVLPAYLTALLVVGLGVCARMGGRFVVLRSLVWWGTMLLGGAWVYKSGPDHVVIACGYLAVVWSLIHSELVTSARVHGLVEGEPVSLGEYAVTWSDARPFAASLSTSTWATALATFVLGRTGGVEWLPSAIACVATAALSSALVPPGQVLRQSPRSDAQRLGQVLVLEAGAALIAAVALAMSGWLQVGAWLALGVGAAAAGTSIRSRGLHAYGLVVLAIAAGRLLAFDWWSGTLHEGGWSGGGLVLTRWSLLVVLAGAAWVAAAVMVSRRRGAADDDPFWTGLATAACTLGIVLLGASLLRRAADLRSLCIAWTGLSLAAIATRRLEPRFCTERVGLSGLVAATGAWSLRYPPYPMEDWLLLSAPPLLSQALWLGLMLASAFAAAAWWTRRKTNASENDRLAAAVGLTCAAVVTLVASTSEVARVAASTFRDDTARHAAVSIWWGLFGVALIVAGFGRRVTAARHCGLALLGVAAMKAVLFDLSSVRAEARVASFIGLGLLMIGVAVLYAKVSARMEADKRRDRESIMHPRRGGLSGAGRCCRGGFWRRPRGGRG